MISRFAEACRALASERDPVRLLELGLRAAMELTDATRGAVVLTDANDDQLPRFTSVGFDSAPDGPSFEGALVAPLTSPAGMGGRLYLMDKALGCAFDATDRELASAIGAQLGIACAHARLTRQSRATESKYRTLVEQIPAVTYYRSLESPGTPWFVSPQIRELTGFTPEEFVADPQFWARRIHPDDRERVLAQQREYRPALPGQPVRVEYRVVHRDGSVRWVHNYALSVRDEAGRAERA